MKLLITFLLISFSNLILAQELVFELNLPRKGPENFKQNYIIENTNESESVLYYLEMDMVNSFRLDENFNLIQQYKAKVDSRYTEKLIGGSSLGSRYTLYYSDRNYKSFYHKTIDYDKREDSEREILFLDVKKEKYLESLRLGDKFYVFTLYKHKEIFKIYEFQADSLTRSKEFDVLSYKNEFNSYYSLYNLLSKTNGYFKSKLNITKIDNSSSVPIESAAERIKLFNENGKLFITINTNESVSAVLEINLNTFQKSEKEFINPKSKYPDYFIQANSFYLNDKLFIVSSTIADFYFEVHDYNSEKILKRDSFSMDQDIPFKNSEMMKEGGIFEGEISAKNKTKRFLRLVSNGGLGLSAFLDSDSNFVFTFGSKIEVSNSSGGFFGGGFVGGNAVSTPYGIVYSPVYHYNSVGNNYFSSNITKGVFFKSLFNYDLVHTEGEVRENIFEVIKKYKYDKLGTSILYEDVFHFKDYYLLSYYDRVEESIFLRKFTYK